VRKRFLDEMQRNPSRVYFAVVDAAEDRLVSGFAPRRRVEVRGPQHQLTTTAGRPETMPVIEEYGFPGQALGTALLAYGPVRSEFARASVWDGFASTGQMGAVGVLSPCLPIPSAGA
jgi:hypothetical protein